MSEKVDESSGNPGGKDHGAKCRGINPGSSNH